jgi:glycosyltransferase involved in cell wall biosynthesis
MGIMAGSGPLLEEMRDLSRRLSAPVEIVGHREDIRPFLARSWALGLFSEFEGIPFAVEEAMWAGRAVVASDLPSLRWLIDQAGFLVRDVGGTVAAFRRLTDRDTATGYGALAATRIRSMITPDMPWSFLEQQYERFLRVQPSDPAEEREQI